MRKRYGDVFAISLDGEPLVVVGDAGLTEEIVTAPADVLHAGEGNSALAPLLGSTSLPLLDGERHMDRRKLLLPRFGAKRLKRFEQTIVEVAEDAIGKWPREEKMPIWPRMQQLTLEVVLRLALGDASADNVAALRRSLRGLRVAATPGQRVPLQDLEDAVAIPNRVLDSELGRRRRLPRDRRGDDILALVASATREDGSPLSDAEIRNETMTVLITGHETTGTALAWALDLLTHNPAAHDRVRAEARDGETSFTQAVVRETLRLRPPLPLMARRTKRPYRLGEHMLPADVTILPSPLLIHHREDVYPQSAAFRPERFLEEPPGTYTWIPFGGGVRRCIGSHLAQLEIRLVLATILRNLSVRAARPKLDEMRSRATTLTPAHGVQVVLGSPDQI